MAEAETETEGVEGTPNGTCPPDTGFLEGTGKAETVKKEEPVTVDKENTTGAKEMEKDCIENEKNGTVGKGEDHQLKEEENKREREEQELEDVKMEEETETEEGKETKAIVENADANESKENVVENADAEESKENIVENADAEESKENIVENADAEESKENVVENADGNEEKERKENVGTAQEKEEKDSEGNIENAEENKEETVKTKLNKEEKRYNKRGKGLKVGGKEVSKHNEVDEKNVKATNTPMASSLDRPVRERKSVERLVVSIEKEPTKDFHIEKGRGTPLKEIPNVAYKLSRKKTDETFKSLYMILFGRRGKASDIKKNISQFSGFVWHENEEKPRMKLKEKFDKCFKEKLVEFCDVLDIPVVKTATRKEDIVVKLIDFLAAPHVMTDVLIAEKEQSSKDLKRKRSVKGSASKSGGTSAKSSSRKRRKSEGTPKGNNKKSTPETEDEFEEEDEENDNGIPDAPEEVPNHSGNEDKDDESLEESEEDMRKHKRGSRKSSLKKESAGKTNMKKCTTSRKDTPITSPKKTPRKTSSKHSEVNNSSDKSPRVFSRKKKKNEETKKKASNPVKSATTEKAGKKVVKGKDKSKEEEAGPTRDELRRAICEILKEVDFNTATFTDILKLLARQFNTDLTPRKSAIKLLIQEELTKLADEAEDNGDDEGEGDEKEDQLTAGQEVEA